MSRATRRRRLLLIAAGSAVCLLLVVGVWLEGEGLPGSDLTGTMGSATMATLGPLEAEWDGAGNRLAEGQLGEVFSLRFEAHNPGVSSLNGRYQLYFSRDADFDPDQDCLVGEERVLLPASGRGEVAFRNSAYLTDCLDAGPWQVAVFEPDTERWTELDRTVSIRGAVAQIALAEAPAEVGYRGSVDLQLTVSRASGRFGAEGLYLHPVDVWLKKEEDLCLLEAAPLSLPRVVVAAAQGTWATSEIPLQVSLTEARKVRSMGGVPDPFDPGSPWPDRTCEGCARVEVAGRCDLSEGTWSLTAGPAAPGFHATRKLYVNAPPVRLDSEPITLTLSEGEAGFVERKANNPSARSVRWHSRPAGDFGADWMVGMRDQELRGGAGETIRFTFSAASLSAGRYTGEFVFVADDFYGTQVAIPVELIVEASRKGGADLPVEQFALSNYPNPFSSRTTIVVQVEREGRFKLAIHDVQGREVRLLLDEWMSQGRQEVPFDANDLPSGTYLYRLVGEGVSVAGTMSLVR